ncbi:MAG TPA: hypothetical protein VL971_09820 [Rhizomicrobium sp.]|nr:hypothetical protein [Rhizomicrobium sp.]
MIRPYALLLAAAALIAAQPSFAAISPQTTKTQAAAPKADPEKDGAAQAVAIFLNCAHFGGDVAALRNWAAQSGLAEAPPDQATPFLLGKGGKVFGGDTPSGQLILASEDDGVCSVFAGHADGKLVLQGFEDWLKQNGFTFSSPHPIHHSGKGGLTAVSRNYAIHGQGELWHAVITITTGGKSQFEAVLTAYRNKK